MDVEFLERFEKDIDKLRDTQVKRQLKELIEAVEGASSFKEIQQVKKLSGFKRAYRIRLGEYCVGVLLNGTLVTFCRVVHRRDIYRVFP